AGIGMVALPAGVFASAFSDEIRDRETAKLERREKALEKRMDKLEAEREESGTHG
ncbi:MAG TPA: ion transporter, partial [Henriciella marina]|nr:ion transporter [Henriciella marina]